MIIIDPPEHLFRIKILRMNCSEVLCPFKAYDSFVKRYTVCSLKEPYFVRRTKIDKNGRIYLNPYSKPKCCIKILDDDMKNKDVPYASSEIEYIKEMVQ